MAIGKPAGILTVLFCAASMLAGGFAVASRAHASPAAGRTTDDSYDWAKWREFWSFRPVTKAPPPAVKSASWVRNEIDGFVLAKLEANGLKPAPEADRSTLIRRATFDLTGLPPSPQEIRAFLRQVARCLREGDRAPPRQPPLWRALGPALAGRRPLHAGSGLVPWRETHQRRLALPRLRGPRVQQRQAVRPVPDRA